MIDRAERSNADGVLVIQLISLEPPASAVDANPDATYIFRPTYYYNVSVRRPDGIRRAAVSRSSPTSSRCRARCTPSQSTDQAWSIRSDWKIKEQLQPGTDYKVFTETAKSIVDRALRDGVIAQ